MWQHGDSTDEQELIAAKLMGRWRRAASRVLVPKKDDPALGAEMHDSNVSDLGNERDLTGRYVSTQPFTAVIPKLPTALRCRRGSISWDDGRVAP